MTNGDIMSSNRGPVYHFDRDSAEVQLMLFASREISFRVRHLGMTYSSIAMDAGVSNTTVANISNGKTKHPQFRTLVPILMALGFEFDAIASEAVQSGGLEVLSDGKVVQLPIRPRKGGQ